MSYLNGKNVVKSWKTSLIGFALIAAGIASVFVKEATWTESAIIITIGIGLLFAPDKTVKKL